jgi:hypothetical protein
MRKREEDDSAIGFRSAIEWRQDFREFPRFRCIHILRRRVRVHAPELRLPLSQ